MPLHDKFLRSITALEKQQIFLGNYVEGCIDFKKQKDARQNIPLYERTNL